MFSNIKLSGKKLIEKTQPQAIKTLKQTVNRYSKAELREQISTEDGCRELASKVFHQLPEGTKKMFNDDSKEHFVNDVVVKLEQAKKVPKMFKKIFGM